LYNIRQFFNDKVYEAYVYLILQLLIVFGVRLMAEQWTRISSELQLANITGTGILKI
jgi:hypothetical protein